MKSKLLVLGFIAFGFVGCASKGDFKSFKKEMKADFATQKTELKKEMKSEMKKAVLEEGKQELIMEMKNQVYSESKKELEQYKVVVNKVIAKKLAEYKVFITEEIKSALINGPFIPLLEEKIKAGLSAQQNSMFEEKRKLFIEQVVEEALDQIIARPIGVKATDVKVLP